MESTSSLHSGRPYWAKRAQSPRKTYFLYWEPSKKTWYISDTLGSRTGNFEIILNIIYIRKYARIFPIETDMINYFLTKIKRNYVHGKQCQWSMSV